MVPAMRGPVLAAALVLALAGTLPAQTGDLPIFDTHVHYSAPN